MTNHTIPAPTCIVCAEHDEPRTVCTGCDDAFHEPGEELTAATFHRVEDHPRTICAGQYCHYCCEQIIYMHRTGEVTTYTFDGPFTVAMMGDGPQ